MFGALARRLFGSANDRYVKSLGSSSSRSTSWSPSSKQLSDEALRARTAEFKQRLGDGAELDDLLVEAFATVREAAKRTLGQRHFDVQLIGGMVLHRGMIAEMKTGEGKTLVATLPVYLNALTGKGVHVVTVNDYLARRDAEWMGQIYSFLGLTRRLHRPRPRRRRSASRPIVCDITYGTNNELGFDYLRDNMKFRLEEMVQRPFHYAIVDEVDSILIDEARTPLIISRPDRGQFRALHPGRQADPGARCRAITRRTRSSAPSRLTETGPGADRGAAARARPAEAPATSTTSTTSRWSTTSTRRCARTSCSPATPTTSSRTTRSSSSTSSPAA